MVSNRNKNKLEKFKGKAIVVKSSKQAIALSDIILLTLPTEREIKKVLLEAKGKLIKKTILNLSTISPTSSIELSNLVSQLGSEYIESPVSGSRGPAEEAKLTLLTAGDKERIECLNGLLSSIGKTIIYCGPIPAASKVKLANNLLLISMFTGLAEAVNFATKIGVSKELYLDVIEAGPMSNGTIKSKRETNTSTGWDTRDKS